MTEPTDPSAPKATSWDFAALDAAGAALAGRVAREAGAAGGGASGELTEIVEAEPAVVEVESADAASGSADVNADPAGDAVGPADEPADTAGDADLEGDEPAGAPPGSSVSTSTDTSGPEAEVAPESVDNSAPEFEVDREPADAQAAELEADAVPEATPEPDAEADSAQEPAAEPEAGPELAHEPDAAPEPAPEPQPGAEPQPDAEPETQDLDAAAVTAALEAADLANATPEDIEDSGLPDLTNDQEFDGALESVLLVVDSPIHEDQLSSALEQPVKRVEEALSRISTRYTESGSGIDLRRVGDGWRFYTRDRFAPFVEKLLLDGQRAKLTRAALETLAVIAYRQPVTRARIAAVRGVNVDGVIRTLVARGLIEEIGTDSDTGGILYRTTELFLERLGLPSLADLPPIAPLLPEVDAIDDV